MKTGRLTFHLLPNAHLDPVWLWDWREGLNEGIITTRTVLDLMDELPRTGSLATLTPETFRLLAIKPAQDGKGWIVRVQETAGKGGRPALTWLGRKVKLDAVAAQRIASWRLSKKGGRWQAERVSAQG